MPKVSGVSSVHLEEDVRVALTDANGNPFTPANPLPTTGGGASSPFVVITDPNDGAKQAAVTNAAPASNEFGAVVRIAGNVPFSATDLDIRDLVFATDKVDVSDSVVQVGNFPATQPVSGTIALDAPSLAALELVGVKGADGTSVSSQANRLPVGDDYATDILTPDQTGAGAVLSFALGVFVPFVTVDVDPVNSADTANYICRVTLNGTTPTASLGHRARGGQTTYLPFPSTGTVKVFAPTGVFVSVQAGSR